MRLLFKSVYIVCEVLEGMHVTFLSSSVLAKGKPGSFLLQHLSHIDLTQWRTWRGTMAAQHDPI